MLIMPLIILLKGMGGIMETWHREILQQWHFKSLLVEHKKYLITPKATSRFRKVTPLNSLQGWHSTFLVNKKSRHLASTLSAKFIKSPQPYHMLEPSSKQVYQPIERSSTLTADDTTIFIWKRKPAKNKWFFLRLIK